MKQLQRWYAQGLKGDNGPFVLFEDHTVYVNEAIALAEEHTTITRGGLWGALAGGFLTLQTSAVAIPICLTCGYALGYAWTRHRRRKRMVDADES